MATLLAYNNNMVETEVLPPTILVIFGISGDLSRRYLLPALSAIKRAGHVKDNFVIVGVSRRQLDVNQVIPEGQAALRAKTQMVQMDVTASADFTKLKTTIDGLKTRLGKQVQVIFYLVVPPAGVPALIEQLGQAKLNGPDVKLLLEKPFGTDLKSAQDLIGHTGKYFKENQVYRIDHYLAKEMAQNISVFLGSNAIFRNVWSSQFVERIEIDVLEEIGVAGRADFYDPTGALRDIIQSHGLQLAALTLMEPCSDIFDFEEIPRRRLAALKTLNAAVNSVVRAQYDGYQADVGSPDSLTETFVSMTLSSSDKRWRNVPITMTTGKKLDQKLTEIRIFFKPAKNEKANILRLRVQPREAIELDLWVKNPGYQRRLQQLPLNFSYQQHFKHLPNAYEQVLIDAMVGNHSLFAGSGEIIESWRILQPILDAWQSADAPKLLSYAAGAKADSIVAG